MRTNVAPARSQVFTAEGGPGKRITPEQQLRRLVCSCLLWESEFYADGKTIAEQIVAAAHACKPEFVLDMSAEARHTHHMRHVSLFLLCAFFTHPRRTPAHSGLAVNAVALVVDRADELAELVALWWKDGKRPLPSAMKRGLALAFHKFGAHQFAKYDREGAVRLRDVMFLVRPNPVGYPQAAVFKQVADRTLPVPETWEVLLSAGADKRETFEALIRENKLGYMALLRNLRNMTEAGCDRGLVREAIIARRGAERVLPFRYVAAARACPSMEPAIDQALCDTIRGMEKLPGRTAVLVDVSGSMDSRLSAKSDMTRMDAACALASILPGEDVRVFSFSNEAREVPRRLGMAGVEAIRNSQPHGGTALGGAVDYIQRSIAHDRIIVITDEQSHDRAPDPLVKNAYMINVASAKNGVGYGKWTHIDGFSEGVIRYIGEIERQQ